MQNPVAVKRYNELLTVYKLNKPIDNAECWNFHTKERFVLRSGLSFHIAGTSDNDCHIISIVDPNNQNNSEDDGIKCTYTDKFTHKTYNQQGYRFIVNSKILNEATGLDLPTFHFDLVGKIMDYENGELDDDNTLELFRYLISSGTINSLQGSYQRTAKQLEPYL